MSNDHNLDELEAFANQFDTDKQAKDNGYLPLYIEYFKRQELKRNKVQHILEYGTNKGSSLRMWAEYFPNAQVYGIDVTRIYEIPNMLNHNHINTFICDCGDRDTLKQLKISQLRNIQFDMIIDDASHEASNTQVAFGVTFPWLKQQGLYIIEDLIVGQNFFDANTYNKKRIIPTRSVIKIFEQTRKLESPVITNKEKQYIQNYYDYCEYRESNNIVYNIWHPEIAFIGKK
jgi:predicted O-methyltransferase YrrM